MSRASQTTTHSQFQRPSAVSQVRTSGRWITYSSAVAFILSTIAVAAGSVNLFFNEAEFLALGSLPLVSFVFAVLAWRADSSTRAGVLGLMLFSLLCAVVAIGLKAMPEYLFAWGLDAIAHRSLVSSVAAVGFGIAGMSLSLYQYMGATAAAEDYSKYPIVVIPALFALGIYALLIGYLLWQGLPGLSWEVITTPYTWLAWEEMVYDKGWPIWVEHEIKQVGLLNHMRGTLLLMGLTSLFAILPGIGAGVMLAEYAEGFMASTLRHSITILRAMSVFILGLTLVSVLNYAAGSPLANVFMGFYYDTSGTFHHGHGSYVAASLVLALLVIPVIARSTEEGCRSLPSELREGSLALGATEGHTLTRIILPWTAPNIVTAVLLGCAEAAGSVAVIMFIARVGQFGVHPLTDVTSLSFFIFDARYGTHHIADIVRPLQFSAGVLLLMLTMGLSAIALALRHHFAWRYRTR